MSNQDAEGGPQATTVIVENTSKSTLYALLIGINNYATITPLQGAVHDADEMLNFLTNDLKVPAGNIVNLRNSSASRGNIIKGFQDLRNDSRIEKGDPILIYYAGHGGSYRPPAGSKGVDGTEVIFPQDYKLKLSGNGEPVNCIPDKTIAILINELAAAKGDNITVIFDSCHSASGSRISGPNKDTARQSRGADVSMEIPDDIDQDILSCETNVVCHPKGTRRIEPIFYTDQRSHVHLAACGKDERAWEDIKGGAFTVALLRTIRAHGVDQITYGNLIISLPNLPKQSPHCYGHYASRVLFNAHVPSRKVTFVPVKLVPETGTLLLQAGAASGVTYQSTWEVCYSPAQASQSVGRFYAQTPKVSVTELKPEQTDQIPFLSATTRLYARQVGCGKGNELKVWLSPDSKLAIFGSASTNTGAARPGSGERQVGYVVHPWQDSADLSLELMGSGEVKEVVFHLNDSLAIQYGQATLKQRMPARRAQVEKVLFAAAHWHWHLHRVAPTTKIGALAPSTSESKINIGDRVVMELVNYPAVTGAEVQSPLFESNETLKSDSEAGVVVVREGISYAIKITNRLARDLHIGVIYFNPTDFSFGMVHGFESAGEIKDPDISAKSDILITHVVGKGLNFRPAEGLQAELGYLKLFWSTNPLVLPKKQKSPFGGSGQGRTLLQSDKLLPGLWGTSLLAVLQTSKN